MNTVSTPKPLKRELPSKEFRIFTLQYGYIGGTICEIKNHLILEEFTTKELMKEIKRRSK